MIFLDTDKYKLTEGKNFKTFLKENYAIALDICYLFTTEMLKMDLNMISIVLMEIRKH